MRLTRRKTLEITRELWGWLAETGARLKGDWPGFAKYGEMLSDCPCCEYRGELRSCSCCPLYPRTEILVNCEEDGEPFEGWLRAGTKKTRMKYAQQMVSLCDKRLRELK